jgi:hypothetical protein
MSDIERHTRAALAELGVIDPSTELLRAQMILEHSKNATVLAQGLAVQLDPFGHAEETAYEFRNRLLRQTPMGASAGALLQAMAGDAIAEVGKSTDVHIESATPHSSRYVQYLLRTEDGSNPYKNGIAVVTGVWANARQHVFLRPILIAAGEGLNDPRRPYDWRDLVRALHEAGLKTNDALPQ